MTLEQQMQAFTVRICPICGKSHSFSLAIRRSFVSALSDDAVETVDTVTCTFACPETGEYFKLPLHFRPPTGVRIQSVQPEPATSES